MTTPAPPQTDAVADAPQDAFRLTCSPMQFMDVDEHTPELRPFQMIARSLEPIEHYYWGRIVHDLSGMQLRKDKCPVDWCHSEWDEIGYADAFDITDDGLQVVGNLIVLEPQDRADKVFKRGKAGMPYEASIDWIGPGSELEWIPEDVSTEVNGRQFEGPGYVVRKWPLRSVAVCPYGADSDTSTQFSDSKTAVQSVRVFTQSTETPAVDPNAPTDDTTTETDAPDEAKQQTQQPAPEAPTAPAVPAGSISADTLKQFSDAFGPKAMEYLSAGLTIDAARLQFAEHKRQEAEDEAKKLTDQLTEKDTQLQAAHTQLKQFGADIGQPDPLGADAESAAEPGDSNKVKLFSAGKALQRPGSK